MYEVGSLLAAGCGDDPTSIKNAAVGRRLAK